MAERCGERTRTGTECRWLVDECPVRTHQRRRAERIDWDNAPRTRLPDQDADGQPQKLRFRPHRKSGMA